MNTSFQATRPASGPFLIGDVAALRDKITHLPPRWARRWQRFLDEARTGLRTPRWYAGEPCDRQLHGAFAHLVTGQPEFADQRPHH